MASLTERVSRLEAQLVQLQETIGSAKSDKDWRRTIGMFTDDAGMRAIFDEAIKLRETDREKTRRSSVPTA